MITISRVADLGRLTRVENLSGVTFTGEDEGHKFVITAMLDNAIVPFTGSVSGKFIRPGGYTVALTQAEGYAGIEEGNAWVSLAGNCYSEAGPFGLTITHIDGTKRTVIYACAGYIRPGETTTIVDPESLINVDAIAGMISDMQDAIDDATTAAAFVPNVIAPAYSASGTYAVGDYCTKDGYLYRCNTAISTAEAWTAAHWTQVTAGAELGDVKSALNDVATAAFCPSEWQPDLASGSYIKAADGTTGSSNKYARTALFNGYGYRAAVVLNDSDYECSVAFYDATGSLSASAGSNGFLGHDEYSSGIHYIPPEAIKFGVSFRRVDQATLSTSTGGDIDKIKAALSAYAPTDTGLTIQGAAADAKATGEAIGVIRAKTDAFNAAMTEVWTSLTVGSTTRGYWSYTAGGTSSAVDASSGSYYRRPAIEIPANTRIKVENSRYYNSTITRPVIITDASYNILTAYTNDGTLGNTDYDFITPASAKYLLLTQYQSSTVPAVKRFDGYENVTTQDTVITLLENLNAEKLDWAAKYGTTSYPLGWISGWYDAESGEAKGPGSNTRLRTIDSKLDLRSAVCLIIEPPTGYWIRAYRYKNGVFVDSIVVESGPVLVQAMGYHFTFTVGPFDNGDSTDYINSTFINQLKVTVVYGESNDTSRTDYFASMSLFNRFGVCGASWDSGYCYYNNGSNVTEKDYLAWGSNVARNHGITCRIYAHHSMWTREYLTNQYCLPKLLNDSPCGLYYLGLGGNDTEQGLSYLGTIADITNDYTQNPDTFYGNYARIVEQIQAHSPGCKIICQMAYDPYSSSAIRKSYFDAVQEIAAHYGLPTVNWFDDPWYAQNVSKNLVGNHPTATQLSGIALAWDRVFAKCVRDNYDYFKDYIGFDFA